MRLAPARFALDKSASNNSAPVMSAPRKSAHLASIRLRSASTSFAPERSARCSVLRNNVASLRSASFKITRSSFMRLKSRALRSRPDRSHAMQDFVVPAKNASTSAANPDAAIPTKTPSAMPNFILPADLPAILRSLPTTSSAALYQTDDAARRAGKGAWRRAALLGTDPHAPLPTLSNLARRPRGQSRARAVRHVISCGRRLCPPYGASIRSTRALMPEMPGAGEYHGDAVIVRCLDHLAIAHRAARLDHGGRTSLDRHHQPIRKREERVGGHHRALREGRRQTCLHRGIGGLARRNAGGIDPAHLAGPDPDRGAV